MDMKVSKESLKPVTLHKVYDLVKQTGYDVSPWEVSKTTGLAIDPKDAIYQNTQWNFGMNSPGQPLVACMWWIGMKEEGEHLVFSDSIGKDAENKRNQLANLEKLGLKSKKAQLLRTHVNKIEEFAKLIAEAYLRYRPVHVIFVREKDRKRTDDDTDHVDFRELDSELWYVHEHEPETRTYRMIRGLVRAPVITDPLAKIEDPKEDPVVQSIEASNLSATEKEALIKARVGQGYFRQQLMARWNGCSVTKVTNPALLIASHIKPWRSCESKEERLSPDNGLLLTPNLDNLFDQGLISFDERAGYRIMVSSKLSGLDKQTFDVLDVSKKLKQAHAGMEPFMKYHRENVFQPK